MIDRNTNNDTWNIRKQAIGYIMSLKKKQSAKVKAKGCAGGRYHQKFNHELESSSHIIPSCFQVGSYVMNTMDYNGLQLQTNEYDWTRR